MTGPSPLPPLAAIVLAGGHSRRMGQDKATLDWAGQPMLARIVETLGRCCDPVLVVASEVSAAYRSLKGTGGPPATWITDEDSHGGALGALAAGLDAAARAGAQLAFVCATDMPLVSPELVDELSAALTDSIDVVVAHDCERDHPMAGIYRVQTAGAVADLARAGERRMTAVLDAVVTRRITVSDPEWLTNVNAPEDLHRLRESAGR